jgi:hypothetical protein
MLQRTAVIARLPYLDTHAAATPSTNQSRTSICNRAELCHHNAGAISNYKKDKVPDVLATIGMPKAVPPSST